MTFVADEGVDSAVVSVLRRMGHAVLYIAEAAPGQTDGELLELANAQNALLLTADKDFGELVFRLGRVHKGVVLLRLMSLAAQAETVAEIVRRYGVQMWGAFTVIAPKTVRIRPKLGS